MSEGYKEFTTKEELTKHETEIISYILQHKFEDWKVLKLVGLKRIAVYLNRNTDENFDEALTEWRNLIKLLRQANYDCEPIKLLRQANYDCEPSGQMAIEIFGKKKHEYVWEAYLGGP